jgi:hypothetical protein
MSVLVWIKKFLASTEKSYDAFCPFAFQGETQKISENVDV